jgi:molybdopterin-guanine dinucleotide biosynthesis protein A
LVKNTKETEFENSFPIDVGIPNRFNKVSAAILAGGQSKRMGTDKALLPVGGQSMIKHVVETVRVKVREVNIISNEPQKYAFLNLPIYKDAVQKRSPLVGIYTALLHSRQQRCLTIACDLPFLSAELIQFLCENCDSYDVLAFESDSGIEPLCAVYSKNCLPVIEKQIHSDNFKITNFYHNVLTRIVPLGPGMSFYDSKVFFNVNTREELKQARNLCKPQGMEKSNPTKQF